MDRMRWFGVLLLVAWLVGCDETSDADAGVDAGAGEHIALDGLDGDVEVIVDDRGMPHIYASTIHDLQMVQGYMMARDRFIQMEFIRRAVTGRLAEVLGSADAGLVDDDTDSRFLGFGRVGRQIYESLPADDRSRLVAEAFVAGINAYIDEVVSAVDYVPPEGLELFNLIRLSPNFGHWEPADIFALARFQAYNLSYDAGADISRSAALAAARAAFDPASRDEVISSRAGVFADFLSERPARQVFTRAGFNDGSTSALLPGISSAALSTEPPASMALPSLAVLTAGERFFERLARRTVFYRDEHMGSNSWVVHGSLTAGGNPILSNDPHLSLISPGVWWYVHLNTERMGGELALDTEGVAFAGLPGVVLGYNRDIAWSATTTGYDVTDVYDEEITYRNDGTPAEPRWVPVSATFETAQVALTTISEEIRVAGRTQPVIATFYVVPHHGPLIPDTLRQPTVLNPETGATAVGGALSVRYTGHEPTNELAFFLGLLTATSVDEALAAQDNFRVGAQNFSFATRSGDIAWSTESRIPQRQPDACTFAVNADGTIAGTSPLFVLPGQGGFEWTGDLDPRFIPHDRNPAAGFIATANQDNVGVTADGNPCNDGYYLGGGFAVGYRMARIVQRLDALRPDTSITPDDMIALQAESRSSLGETLRDPIVAALNHALADPSDDAVLAAAVTAAGAHGVADLTAVRDRLMAWSFETPHGIGATGTELSDSVATTIFNATITRLTGLAFGDEADRIGRRPPGDLTARLLEWSLADAAAQQALPLYTFRASYGRNRAWNDTVLWDDLGTVDVEETRHERVVRAVLAAVQWLETDLGADWNEWRWGRLHAVRFGQVVPAVGSDELVSIPPSNSTEFPIGFPRHGDFGAVDVGNFSMWDGVGFTHGSGASQRFVVEMTPSGPRAFNALPGGQSENIASPHHADEAEHWRVNSQPPMYFERADVEAHAESTFRFAPRP